MKKRIISLVLVVAMLLCVLPAASAADGDPALTGYYLSLSESIAIKFVATNADDCYVTFDDDTKAVYGKNGVFTYSGLCPADLSKKITVVLHNADGTVADTKEGVSALGYCNAILKDGSTHSDYMKNLATDLINFGKAFRTYKVETGKTVHGDDFNAVTSDYASDADIFLQDNETYDGVEYVIELNDSVDLYFKAEGAVKMEVEFDGGTYTLDEPVDGKFYFKELDPSDMRKMISVTAYDEGGTSVGTLKTSIESYAAYCNSTEAIEACAQAAAVTEAMMKYGDAATGYVLSKDSSVLYHNNFNSEVACSTMSSRERDNCFIGCEDGQFVATNRGDNSGNRVALTLLTVDTTKNYEKVSVEWDFRMTWDSAAENCAAGLHFNSTGSNTDGKLLIDACKEFRIADKVDSGYGFDYRCEKNKAYRMRVELDFTEYKYNLFINDNLVKSGDMRNYEASTYFKNVVVYTKANNSSATATAYVDNVVVKKIS